MGCPWGALGVSLGCLRVSLDLLLPKKKSKLLGVIYLDFFSATFDTLWVQFGSEVSAQVRFGVLIVVRMVPLGVLGVPLGCPWPITSHKKTNIYCLGVSVEVFDCTEYILWQSSSSCQLAVCEISFTQHHKH